jgi:hypothetical protein
MQSLRSCSPRPSHTEGVGDKILGTTLLQHRSWSEDTEDVTLGIQVAHPKLTDRCVVCGTPRDGNSLSPDTRSVMRVIE